MKRPLLMILRNCAFGAAVGFAAAKLLPAPVVAAAALGIMIWCWISLRQLKQMAKENNEILERLKQVMEWRR